MISNPLLLEINTRCWLQELSVASQRRITLGSVPEGVLNEWRRRGVTHLWLMGVWVTGPLSRARALTDSSLLEEFDRVLPGWTESDVPGSPYAIERYAVSEGMGGESGLQEFRCRLHSRGLKLVLDFVPNHIGLDHRWIHEHPEYCVQAGDEHSEAYRSHCPTGGPRWLAHGRDPHFPPWDDTVQLDYRREDVHRAMQAELLAVAALCDGVRCDMAMLLQRDIFEKTWADFPLDDAGEVRPRMEFWGEAIRRVKSSHRDFVFLAEVYWGMEEPLQQIGFDYTYDKPLTESLLQGRSAEAIRHLHGRTGEVIRRGAHFLENHDEPRVSSVLSIETHRAAALATLGLPGMRFLHEGQTDGATVRTPVQLSRRRVEPVDLQVRGMYEALFDALRSARVGQGDGNVLPARPAWAANPSHQGVLAIRWNGPGARPALVVINLAVHRCQCRLPLGPLPSRHPEWELADELSEERWIRPASELEDPGLFLDLAPHATQVFVLKPHNALEAS